MIRDFFVAMVMFNLGNVGAQLDFLQKVSVCLTLIQTPTVTSSLLIRYEKSDVSSDQGPLFFAVYRGFYYPVINMDNKPMHGSLMNLSVQ